MVLFESGPIPDPDPITGCRITISVGHTLQSKGSGSGQDPDLVAGCKLNIRIYKIKKNMPTV